MKYAPEQLSDYSTLSGSNFNTWCSKLGHKLFLNFLALVRVNEAAAKK